MHSPTVSMPSTRSLGLASATALVVANMVGTGVFTTSGFLLADLKSLWPVLGVWLVGGVLAALGALMPAWQKTATCPPVSPPGTPHRSMPFSCKGCWPYLLWSSTFDQLLTYIGFTLGLSTAATVVGLIRIRLQEGSHLRVPGWPWVPASFLAVTLAITGFAIARRPNESLAGFATILLGLLAWAFAESRRKSGGRRPREPLV